MFWSIGSTAIQYSLIRQGLFGLAAVVYYYCTSMYLNIMNVLIQTLNFEGSLYICRSRVVKIQEV